MITGNVTVGKMKSSALDCVCSIMCTHKGGVQLLIAPYHSHNMSAAHVAELINVWMKVPPVSLTLLWSRSV